ncbi:beta-propeller fold lactonase family protein [Rhizobium puerariae]|uniref:Beta-propeller fold lactonase family protein n=1 Tax=Rhizobium puerariae TaxID=1585791 RepID=A0ABV6AE96_9HYPH
MARSPNGLLLYAAFRGQPYRVHVFAIDRSTAELHLIGTRPLPADIRHLSLDRTGSYLFGASCNGGGISISRVGEDGLPGAARMLETPPPPTS